MKILTLVAVSAFAFMAPSYAQISETVTPNTPLSAADANVQNVWAAEQQIQRTEQAVALEKARIAEKEAKARAAAANRIAKQRADYAEARRQKIEAQKLKEQNYRDELRRLDLESRKLDLEAKRSEVQTQIELNKVRQKQAVDTLDNLDQTPKPTGSSSSGSVQN